MDFKLQPSVYIYYLHVPGHTTGLCLSPETYSLISDDPVTLSSLARSFSFATSTAAGLTADPRSSSAAPSNASATRRPCPDRGASARRQTEKHCSAASPTSNRAGGTHRSAPAAARAPSAPRRSSLRSAVERWQ